MAIDSQPGPHTIQFDPALRGSTIEITGTAFGLRTASVTINGDADGDGEPDITLDGKNNTRDCFWVSASDETISGLRIVGFQTTCVSISPDGTQPLERVTVSGNTLTAGWTAVHIGTAPDQQTTIRNVTIARNKVMDCGSCGVDIQGGTWPPNANTSIANVSVTDNMISNHGYAIAVFVNAATSGCAHNTISGVIIAGNTITGHTNSSVLINAGGGTGTHDNRVSDVSIRGNTIDVPTVQPPAVAIEIVGGGQGEGMPSLPAGMATDVSRNATSGVTVSGNTLRGCILITAAYGAFYPGDYPTTQNYVRDVVITSNRISNSQRSGIDVEAGVGNLVGATNNGVEQLTIANNLVFRNDEAGIVLIGGRQATANAVRNVTIVANTIVENGLSGQEWASALNITPDVDCSGNTVTGVTVANSILWNADGENSIFGPFKPDTVNHSILHNPEFVGRNGNLNSDPLFVDPTNMDYQLTEGSPAIDQGDPSTGGEGGTDLDGNPRVTDGDGDGVAVVDIGAFESPAVTAAPDTPVPATGACCPVAGTLLLGMVTLGLFGGRAHKDRTG